MFRKKNNFESNGIEYIVAGLGNPGKEYEFTRHNVGFMAVDWIAEKCNTKIKKLKFKALCEKTSINNKSVLLMKPSTFMNLSGESVVEAMNFFKVPPQKVILIFDDINLSPGILRVRKKGSAGGHNGLKNIIYLSGSDDFPRIKIGIGGKPNPNWNLADWVLSRFTKDELSKIYNSSEKSFQAIQLILDGQIESAMNKFNCKSEET